MKAQEKERSGYRTFAFGGGIVGLVSFLAIGLLPSIVYGGFAGVALAAAIFGAPLDASLWARGVVVFGMVVGLLATAAVFVVVGASVGAGLFGLARRVSQTEGARALEGQEAKETATKQ